jgi:hypothetical protein
MYQDLNAVRHRRDTLQAAQTRGVIEAKREAGVDRVRETHDCTAGASRVKVWPEGPLHLSRGLSQPCLGTMSPQKGLPK